jgi:integrase/recombinase XerD
VVKVLRSLFTGPLETYASAFAAGLLRQSNTQWSAEQHVCFIGHLDRAPTLVAVIVNV